RSRRSGDPRRRSTVPMGLSKRAARQPRPRAQRDARRDGRAGHPSVRRHSRDRPHCGVQVRLRAMCPCVGGPSGDRALPDGICVLLARAGGGTHKTFMTATREIVIANAPVSYGAFELTVGIMPDVPDGNTVLDEVAGAGYAGVDLGPLGYLGYGADLASSLRRRSLALSGG